MRTLWITRQDPRPADSGDLIYSLGLLRSLAETGATQITVLAHQGSGGGSEIPGIEWVLPCPVPEKSPLSLLSKLPSDAYRLGNPTMRTALQKLLAAGKFDQVVIDQAASGWALDELPPNLPLLYVAHNHEAVVRREVADSNEGSLPFRLALRRDAANYGRLERRVCARAAAISAITPRDADAFRKEFPAKRHGVLSPGYDQDAASRPVKITSATPRRVMMAGTFEWLAKRRNLEAFLHAAAKPFTKAKLEFHVVGKANPDYFRDLTKQFPWAVFVANVPTMEPHLRNARIGLIPEALGGGFKLKALDYVFSGLPVASIGAALSGLPLNPGKDCLAAASPVSLAEIVTERIDDIEFLNRAAEQALAACRDAFQWSDRGKTLKDILTAIA